MQRREYIFWDIKKFQKFIECVGEDLQAFSGGMCNGLALVNFRADCLNQLDKRHVPRINKFMQMSIEEIIELGNLYHKYKLHNAQLTQRKKSQNPLFTHQQLQNYISTVKTYNYTAAELVQIYFAEEIYITIQMITVAQRPDFLRLYNTNKQRIINQSDFADLLKFIPTHGIDDMVASFEIGFFFTRDELKHLLSLDNLFYEGDRIFIAEIYHVAYARVKNGMCEFYNPGPENLFNTTRAGLAEVIERQFFIENKIDTSYMPIAITIYEPRETAFKKPRPDRCQFIREILEKRNNKNINYKYYNGSTALHLVSELGHADVVDLLISNKANVNETNSCLETPLYKASIRGHLKTISFLHQNGAEINVKNYLGRTPLFCTAMQNDLLMAKMLIAKGAEVDVFNNTNYSLLEEVAKRDFCEMMQLLLPYSEILRVDNLLHYALRNKSNEMIKVFCDSKRINMNQCIDINRNTPLHLAVDQYACLAIVKTLLQNGARENIRNRDGRLPRHLDEDNLIGQAKKMLKKSQFPNFFSNSNLSHHKRKYNGEHFPPAKKIKAH